MYQSYQLGSGFSGRGQARILKKHRASTGPNAGAKSRFSVSDKIVGIKQRELFAHTFSLCKWCGCVHKQNSFSFVERLMEILCTVALTIIINVKKVIVTESKTLKKCIGTTKNVCKASRPTFTI